MKVLVIGASGVAGREVIPRLLSKGFNVVAMVRNKKDFKKFSNIANEVIIGDILDIDTLEAAVKGCACVINLATAIPDWEQTDKIRNEGTKNLISVASKYRVKIIQQSIIFLYGEQKDNIVDEKTETKPFELIQSAANMEQTVINSNLDYIILRGGLFYGSTTGTEDNWFNLAKNNKLQVSNAKYSYNSLIHISDFADACVLAVNSKYSKNIYNVVDNYNVDDKELYDFINKLFDNKKTKTGGDRFLPSLRVSNKKIKKELLWEPEYSSYKTYFKELIN